MTDPTEPHNAASDSPGAILHAERRRQNFSVGDVSRHLKLSTRQVEALERDEFEMFGGPVFVHGFLRNYAKLLGVDGSSLVAAADRKMAAHGAAHAQEEEQHHQPAAPEVVVVENSKKSVVPLLLAAAIVVVGVAGWMLTRDEDPVTEEASESMVSEQSAFPEYGAEEPFLTEPGAVIPPPVPAPQTMNEPQRVTPQAPPAVLQFGFREESWVEVTDRYGEVIYSDLNPAGVSLRVTGEPPLSVVVGNAAGVDLQYNNRIIDLAPHTRVDVARLTLE